MEIARQPNHVIHEKQLAYFATRDQAKMRFRL